VLPESILILVHRCTLLNLMFHKTNSRLKFMNKIVLLIHGWASAGETDKSRYLTERLGDKGISVFSPDLPLHSSPDVTERLNEFFRNVDTVAERGAKIIVVGTSLGAWWAEMVGMIEEIPAILVNPCVSVKSLERYIGMNTNYASGAQFEFTEAQFNTYCKVQRIKDILLGELPTQPIHVITATGDQVCPTEHVVEHYKYRIDGSGSTLTYYNGGDHRFTDYEFLAKAIEERF
jgi:predicted esterase YcpF (UPF0227 family)